MANYYNISKAHDIVNIFIKFSTVEREMTFSAAMVTRDDEVGE